MIATVYIASETSHTIGLENYLLSRSLAGGARAPPSVMCNIGRDDGRLYTTACLFTWKYLSSCYCDHY